MAQVNYLDNGLVFITKQDFTTAATVSFDNCFTNKYAQYKIIFNVNGSADGNLDLRLRASGTDNSSTNYNYQYIAANSTSISGARGTSQSSWSGVAKANTPEKEISIFEILNPFQSTYTTGFSQWPTDSSDGTNLRLFLLSWGVNVTTSYDGFTVFSATGGATITGSVYVYGYKES